MPLGLEGIVQKRWCGVNCVTGVRISLGFSEFRYVEGSGVLSRAFDMKIDMGVETESSFENFGLISC